MRSRPYSTRQACLKDEIPKRKIKLTLLNPAIRISIRDYMYTGRTKGIRRGASRGEHQEENKD